MTKIFSSKKNHETKNIFPTTLVPGWSKEGHEPELNTALCSDRLFKLDYFLLFGHNSHDFVVVHGVKLDSGNVVKDGEQMSLKEVAFKEKCWRVTNTYLKDFFPSLPKWLVSLQKFCQCTACIRIRQLEDWKVASSDRWKENSKKGKVQEEKVQGPLFAERCHMCMRTLPPFRRLVIRGNAGWTAYPHAPPSPKGIAGQRDFRQNSCCGLELKVKSD